MMRIQYDAIVKRIWSVVDEEVELDTREGSDLFRTLIIALFEFHPDVRSNAESAKDAKQ